MHNEVFAEHPDAGGWRPQDLAWHLEEPWFDPKGFLLATDDDSITGCCWMKLGDGDAWVYFLGVAARAAAWGGRWRRPGYRGCRAGARRCHLYVDAAAWAAVGVYASLGFVEDHRDDCYALEVLAASRDQALASR